MIVLPNRKCGKVKQGGLYMVGRKSIFGTLQSFTAIAAPLPAEIANPRKPEVVDTARTLCNTAGLVHPDPHVSLGRFARLPVRGLADYWGQSQGYKSVWGVIEETQALGICRKVANVPSVPLPCPVLMMHAEACVDGGRLVMMEWLEGQRIIWKPEHYKGVINDRCEMTVVDDQPWREANSLGREGDDDFMWHPYVGLWQVVSQLRERRLFTKFRRECGVRFEEGVFGLSWLTDFCYVLKDDEVEVPTYLAKKGVVAAVGQDDPRAKEVMCDG